MDLDHPGKKEIGIISPEKRSTATRFMRIRPSLFSRKKANKPVMIFNCVLIRKLKNNITK
ncbi:hypothetical protein D3C86_2139700 [compost metagenome]